MNQVSIVGRLCRDPELRYSQEGHALASFTIAVDRPWKQNGEKQADFLAVVCWRKTAEVVTQYAQKGSLVGIEGRIQSRSWEGTDGKKQYRTEIVAERVEFLSRSKRQQEEAPAEEPAEAPVDDDVPF